MTENVLFHRIGPYAIRSRLASGGMADVFGARDTRSGRDVALKVPRLAEPGMRETERHGALLQQHLSAIDPRVPQVFEIGECDGVLYVAMEYVDGEDLSERIRRGPLPAGEAVSIAVELCELLATAQGFMPVIEGKTYHGMVHGDIKPRNVRLERDGSVKVLDFGIAKALSESRRLTRNEFGSLPYSSPERIESGHVDAHSDLWSVGVVLYEMLAGSRPLQGDSTRGLERAILSRARPAALPTSCPEALAAILQKALAASLARRYAGAAQMRADLLAFTAGEPTLAEGEAAAEAEPERESEYEATRRTLAPAASDGGASEATRRTVGANADAPGVAAETTRPTISAVAPGAAPATGTRLRLALPRLAKLRRPAKLFALVLAVVLAVNEVSVYNAARELRASLPALRRSDASAIWERYEALESRGWLQFGTFGLGGAVREWLVSSADALLADYRSDFPTIRERGWQEASTLLARAASLAPRDPGVRGRLRYCEGQISRINGQARKDRDRAEASRLFNEAINSFQEASRLRPDWPDPWLALARTYIYGPEDLDRAIEALAAAEEVGHRQGNRETALLADGYRRRAVRLWSEAAGLSDLPQEEGYLERIHADCERALELYERIPAYGEASRNVRAVHELQARVEARQKERDDSSPWWW